VWNSTGNVKCFCVWFDGFSTFQSSIALFFVAALRLHTHDAHSIGYWPPAETSPTTGCRFTSGPALRLRRRPNSTVVLSLSLEKTEVQNVENKTDFSTESCKLIPPNQSRRIPVGWPSIWAHFAFGSITEKRFSKNPLLLETAQRAQRATSSLPDPPPPPPPPPLLLPSTDFLAYIR
jgi:hypothetical protein